MVDIAREPPASIIRIKLRRPAAATLTRLAGVLGVGLPVTPNTVAERNGVRIAWIGPDDWLVTGAHQALAAIGVAIGAETGIARDVGAGYARYRVSGSDAASLLAQGTSLDLDPSVFTPGGCAMTLFAQLSALIEPVGSDEDGPAFVITIDISCATYLSSWLIAAAAGRQGRDI